VTCMRRVLALAALLPGLALGAVLGGTVNSSNVTPVPTDCDEVHGGARDMEVAGDESLRLTSPASPEDLPGLSFGELGHAVAFTPSKPPRFLAGPVIIAPGKPLRVFPGTTGIPTGGAALADPIEHVVNVRSEEQMCWVHTGGLIATVAYAETGRDWTVFDVPRETMGVPPLAIDPGSTVATRSDGSCPQEASSVRLGGAPQGEIGSGIAEGASHSPYCTEGP